MTYDSDGKVVATQRTPRSYDFGTFCNTGKARYFCSDVQEKATETDLLQNLRAPLVDYYATGCFGAKPVQSLPQTVEVPEELKARADEGDVEAMYEYGYALNDLEKGHIYFCTAAHKGYAKAQFVLANYYRWGYSPVEKDLIKVYFWQALSFNGGDPRAANARDQIAREMTADQIAEAESLVTKWKPNPAECEMKAKLATD